jgi:1-acyl-sn-glycerol-3-phosphate acyltransferase
MKKKFSERVYGFLWALLRKPFEWIFAFSHDYDRENVPTLIISNHVTNFDPILVAFSFPGRRFHFVASEHLFRMGFVSKLLTWLFEPIPRRKGVSGGDTAMAILRRLREGKTVCLFAEGETTWDGKTAEIFSATGRLAQMGKCRLITYRLEGGYNTAPRWGKGIRRGKMHGRIVGVYSPAEVKAMGKEVTGYIQRDIFEDADARQKENPVAYGKRNLAKNLEVALFKCPVCGAYETLSSRGNFLHCTCGAKWEYTPYGCFQPATPFETVGQWDAWQRRQLEGESPNFRAQGMRLSRLTDEHGQENLGVGDLVLEDGILTCCGLRVALEEVSSIALVTTKRLLLTVGSDYYELKAKKPLCLRKFLLSWQKIAAKEPSM